MKALTSQEKLALMMTSAGSMRNLAALVGVTHQKIGRWLREGEPGGVKRIPDDPATLDAINTAFAIHSDVAKEQADIDGAPFTPNTPVFQFAKPRNDGKPSDRLFVEDAEFVRPNLRQEIMREFAATRKYQTVTVKSEIDVESYLDELVQREIDQGGTRSRWKKKDLKEYLRDVLQEKGVLGNTSKLALYTKRVPIGPLYSGNQRRYAPAKYSATLVEEELQRAHAPSANQPGGTLAKSFVFQLAPIIQQGQPNVPTVNRPKRTKWTNKRGK